MGRGFDRLATFYAIIETLAFGSLLQKSRCEFLDLVSSGQSILILGDGDGRFVQELLQQKTNLHIRLVDFSRSMLEETRKKTVKWAAMNGHAVEFEHADILEIAPYPPGAFDLVCSHFFLDCFNEETIQRLADHILQALKAEGMWMITDFDMPKKGWKALRARLWISIMYLFFGIVTGLKTKDLPDYRPILRQKGMIMQIQKARCFSMIRSECWIRKRS